MLLIEDLEKEFVASEELEDELQEEVPEVFFENFNKLTIDLGRHYLGVFFEGIQMHYGGAMPKALLYNSRLLSVLLNTTQTRGVDRAYMVISNCLREYELGKHSNITNHMKIVLEIITRCKNLGVPPCFRGGIILAALKHYFGFIVNV